MAICNVNFFLRSARFALVVLCAALAARVSMATPILPGNVQNPAPAESDPIGASLVYSTGPIDFVTATFSGTLTSKVWDHDSSSPYGLDRLTFTYEVSSHSSSPDDIGRLTVSDFNPFLTDTSYAASVGTTAPSSIKRSANGSVIAFNFDSPGLPPDGTSALLVVQTNALFYQPVLASLIDGSVVSVSSLGPSTIPTPEPASLVLFGLGASVLFFAAKRRRGN